METRHESSKSDDQLRTSDRATRLCVRERSTVDSDERSATGQEALVNNFGFGTKTAATASICSSDWLEASRQQHQLYTRVRKHTLDMFRQEEVMEMVS